MADGVAIAGLVFGGIGSAIGIGAVVYAHIGNSIAKRSEQTAEDTKVLAEKANDLARESNTIATDAKQLAEESNDISRRGELRETERHDVHWEGDWETPGRYVLTKLGNDEAHHVTASVVYKAERLTRQTDLISDAGNVLIFEFPSALQDFHREAREHLADLRAARASTYRLGPIGGRRAHRIEERVDWSTPRGNPRHHEDASLATFDRWYPED
ncbi:hypothetical protein FHR72_005173 [Mycolicibacterium iranicum]|uniref:Uncharacterized protein n=1 Tax=Mycolicibacterium iranicum TaxID=912594 RepID=A0A839QKE6_MYCIR|nr:hypothetical protein [Mycolicibacterium iranicum]MBB2993662.1 hypothetical protein [Mycolicibacterium iranicum]